MNIVAPVISIIALLVAYLAIRRTEALEHRLAEQQSEWRRANAAVEQAQAKLEARVQQIGRETSTASGGLRFTPAMTIADAMQLHPGVADVLASFKLTGCSNCAISDVDTLEGACRSYGVDLAALMQSLSNLLEPHNSGDLLQMARASRN
jgi:hybrid cluster-associated redox disulfide protein